MNTRIYWFCTRKFGVVLLLLSFFVVYPFYLMMSNVPYLGTSEVTEMDTNTFLNETRKIPIFMI
jgi:hypothetical protein